MMTKRGGLVEVCVLLFSVLFAGRVWAAPPLVTVQDTLYRADGTPYSGYLVIEWKSFEASDQSAIAMQAINLRIYNGQFKARLVPTTTASPAGSYRVRYVSDGKLQFTETWAVPPSNGPLRVRDVRVASAPGSGGGSVGASTQVNISDVIGLTDELENRPRKGIGYQTGRAAVINGLGEIEAALGADEDCVRVDGSSGPCGAGGGGSMGASFRDGETPTGAVNGVNAVFTLAEAPSPAGSLLLYRNGLLMKRTLDYNLTGNTVTFVPAATPQTEDILVASYRTLGTPVSYSLVLCASVGTAVSGTSFTSLGTCTIPANLLQSGDRLEIVYDFSHQGTTQGGEYEIRYGTEVIASRVLPSSEAFAAGRIGAGAQNAALNWHSQNWGKSIAMGLNAGSFASDFSVPATIDFRGKMAAAGADTLTLRNYTVIRHPRP